MAISKIGSNSVNLASGLDISDGDITLASGHGISYAATANASPTGGGVGNQAELLADYEKGTWTPVDASGASITFAQLQGSYVKIGDQVTAWVYLNFPSSVTHSGATQIIGLPFTTAAAGNDSSGTSARGGGMISFQDTGNNYMSIIVIRATQQLEFFNESGNNFANSAFSGSKTVMACVTYHTGIG